MPKDTKETKEPNVQSAKSGENSQGIPKLEPGDKLDLSLPVLQKGEVKFSLPTELSVQATKDAIVSPLNLKATDWPVIAKHCNLLYGYRMDKAKIKKRVDLIGDKPVLIWKVPESDDFLKPRDLEADVETSITYTERTNSMLKAGFDKASAGAKYILAAASAEYSRKEREAAASSTKYLFMTTQWLYPRARLDLEQCTEPSSHFCDAVRAALAKPDQFKALEGVFKIYGHLYPTKVDLGGQLIFEQSRLMESGKDEKEYEKDIELAANVKWSVFEAQAKTSHQEGEKKSKEELDISEKTKFSVSGGDPTLATNPLTWPNTVKDPN